MVLNELDFKPRTRLEERSALSPLSNSKLSKFILEPTSKWKDSCIVGGYEVSASRYDSNRIIELRHK